MPLLLRRRRLLPTLPAVLAPALLLGACAALPFQRATTAPAAAGTAAATPAGCARFEGWPQADAGANQGWRERERFTAGNYRVVASEAGVPRGTWAKRYLFRVERAGGAVGPDAGPLLFSLGSYDPTDATLRGLGRLGQEAPRVWHLDGYLGARHFTYGIYRAEPAYRDVRARVAEVLAAGDPGRGAISATDGCTGELTLTVDPAVPEFQLDAATTHEVVAAGASAERPLTRR